MSAIQLQEIGSLLMHPSGEHGVEIGHIMNKSNLNMIIETTKSLGIVGGDDILEIGHGNCSHLHNILNNRNNVSYCGLEISEQMKQESERINLDYVREQKAVFCLYNGEDIHFSDNFFSKVLTVNTIYFWKSPLKLLQNIYRVMKKGGCFSIAFVQKATMKPLPFVNSTFELYDTKKIKDLINRTPFKLTNVINKNEHVLSKTGDFVSRDYTIIVLTK